MNTRTCDVEDCTQPFVARGMCKSHYYKWRRANPSKTARRCSVQGCEKPHIARGWCVGHYNRWKNKGDLGDTPIRTQHKTPEESFWAFTNVNPDPDCWEWTAHIGPNGYGRVSIKGGMMEAHRYSWELHNSPIPEGMVIDHKCWNRACVNPSHLQVVTIALNNQNRSVLNSNNTSGARGVSWNSRERKWFATGSIKGRAVHLGRFDDVNEAARVAREWRAEHYQNSLKDHLHQ